MNSELLWQAFVDTGEAAYYLLYKTASEREREEKKQKQKQSGGEKAPSVTD